MASTMESKPYKRQKYSNQIIHTKGNVYQLEQLMVVCNPYTGEKDVDDTRLYNLVFHGIIPRCGVRPCQQLLVREMGWDEESWIHRKLKLRWLSQYPQQHPARTAI